MKRLPGNLLKGLSLGLCVATGLSAWVLLLRLRAGPAPFDRLETTFTEVVVGYYEGGAAGGVLIGLAWPLGRWFVGYALLGMLGVLPFYLFAPGGRGGTSLISTENVASALLGAFFVGGAVGVWIWSDDHPHGPNWFDALRFPSLKGTVAVWGGALFVAILSIVLVPTWSFYWPFELIILAAGVLFIVPLAVAVLVTMRFRRLRSARAA